VSGEKVVKRIVLRGQSLSSIHPAGGGAAAKQFCDLVYLLSPANSAGRRARMLLSPTANFDLAQRLRGTGITLGEAFSFMSSLYFRAKLAYASTFSQNAAALPGTLIITSSRGLLHPETIR